MIKSLQKQRDSLQATLDSLVKEDIYREIDQLAALNSIDVINDNYDLKLHRQDYFTSKQDQVIRMLEEQQTVKAKEAEAKSAAAAPPSRVSRARMPKPIVK